jgi:hypothetical protein
MQDNQHKEPSTDEVRTEYKRIKKSPTADIAVFVVATATGRSVVKGSHTEFSCDCV